MINKKTILLIGFALGLAILYVVSFTDWLKPKKIHIIWRVSPMNASMISFYLDKTYPVTSISVVAVSESRTNKYPHALWHVIEADAAVPLKDFNYGMAPAGMKPKISTALPESLLADTEYSVQVEADNGWKGSRTFSVH